MRYEREKNWLNPPASIAEEQQAQEILIIGDFQWYTSCFPSKNGKTSPNRKYRSTSWDLWLIFRHTNRPKSDTPTLLHNRCSAWFSVHATLVSFSSVLVLLQKKKKTPLALCPAGLCTLATVCCYLAGMDLLHRVSMLPDKVDGSLGWSLYLALISSPLHMMAAALLVWAARSHSQNYYRMTAYRVA